MGRRTREAAGAAQARRRSALTWPWHFMKPMVRVARHVCVDLVDAAGRRTVGITSRDSCVFHRARDEQRRSCALGRMLDACAGGMPVWQGRYRAPIRWPHRPNIPNETKTSPKIDRRVVRDIILAVIPKDAPTFTKGAVIVSDVLVGVNGANSCIRPSRRPPMVRRCK
ncbi:hypothetical protein OH76DRAFT_212231 [Lentinus brumalis]|uniref:Uncharacterized protein n=1 Tax=Lentinus brumalis TaxID=2498619 RepID=A0A371CMQ2_9APHY|nr:hypothetical protein OH76DRAFT_212231 [Polyporus brumalis]